MSFWSQLGRRNMNEQITNGRKPCIWMEAGVVDFKICNLCFDCANCEFDRAMTAAAAQNLALRQSCEVDTEKRKLVQPLKERMRQRSYEQLLEDQRECFAGQDRPRLREVFGFAVPNDLYLHRGHAWVRLENCGRVRIGLDDFSQRLFGPADELRLPEPGQELQRDCPGWGMTRLGQEAAFLNPLYGVVEVVNPKVQHRARLAHDDPYGEGWLFVVSPTNLKPDLENMLFGRGNVVWIENEAHKLLGMLESTAGATLPSGGEIIDDVYGHYPQLGWQRLVKEFLLTDVNIKLETGLNRPVCKDG